MKKYNKYFKDKLDKFLNQAKDERLTNLWEKSNEFWKEACNEYFPHVKNKSGEKWKPIFMENTSKTYQEVKVRSNNKEVGSIFISDKLSAYKITKYALLLIDETIDNFERFKQNNIKILLHFGNIDKESSITITYSNKVKKEKNKKLETDVTFNDELKKEEIDEEECKKKLSEYGYENNDLPDNCQSWYDLYEMYTVANNPKNTLEAGAMVDAIGKENNHQHYGYIKKIKRNRVKRQVELLVNRFGTDETWIWQGRIQTGTWVKKDEWEEKKKILSKMQYTNLVVNPNKYDIKN